MGFMYCIVYFVPAKYVDYHLRYVTQRFFILDPNDLKAVDLGHEGELCIGGPGLARGYRNLPELTAEKFVDHPGISFSETFA